MTMLRIANDLRQSRCPCRADEYHTPPRGKHGCAIRLPFRGTWAQMTPEAKVGIESLGEGQTEEDVLDASISYWGVDSGELS